VCNHPDLFQRRTARFPFTFESPRWLLRLDDAKAVAPKKMPEDEPVKQLPPQAVGILHTNEIEFT
jgi:hypothetical protein